MSFIFLVIAVLLSPIAFGSVEPWAIMCFESLCLAALACRLATKEGIKNIPGLLPLGLLCIIIVLQLVPVPILLLKTVSPGAYRAYTDTILAKGNADWLPASLDKKATLTELFRLVAYGAVYVAAAGILKQKSNIRSVIISVAILGSCMSLEALAQEATAHGKIFWFRQAPYGSSPFGPYVNRNHYAGFMVMLFPLSAALFSYFRPRGRDGRKLGLITALADVRKQSQTARFILAGAAAAMAAASVVLCGSRSGVLAVIVSLIVFSALSFLRKRRTGRSALWTLVLILVFVFAITALMGWGPVFLRFDNTLTGTEGVTISRSHIWADTVRMASDFPITGSGLGSYGSVFPLYRTFEGQNLVLHAHNTYLELMAEGGLITLALAAWFFLSVASKGIRSLGMKGERLADYAIIGALSGATAVLTQTLVDFSLYPLANGIFFFFLMGLVSGASQMKSVRKGSLDQKGSGFSNRVIIKGIIAAMVLIVLVHLGAITARNVIAQTDITSVNKTSPKEKVAALNMAAMRAIRLDPLEGRHHYMACATERLLGRPDTALKFCQKALTLEPQEADYRLQMAQVLSSLDRAADAERFYELSVKADQFNPERHVRLAQWYFSQEEKVKGFAAMRRALELNPEGLMRYLSVMALSGITDEDMAAVLPEETISHLRYASYLVSVENHEAATLAYLKTLDILRNASDANLGYFITMKNYFLKKGRYHDAIAAMEVARDRFPDNVEVLRHLARVRNLSGKTVDAARTYRDILKLDPENREAQVALERLERKQ